MKSTIQVLAILLTFGMPVYGQTDFKVIKVNGTILLRERGISLETGTVFSEKEDLLFRSDDATAAVINSQKGRMVITSRNHDLSAAQSNYLPSMYSIGAFFNYIYLKLLSALQLQKVLGINLQGV